MEGERACIRLSRRRMTTIAAAQQMTSRRRALEFGLPVRSNARTATTEAGSRANVVFFMLDIRSSHPKPCCFSVRDRNSHRYDISTRESNVFKPAVFTPSSLVFEQHLRASRALNPLPTRTDALESRLPIAQRPRLANPPLSLNPLARLQHTRCEQIRVWNPVLARSREDVRFPLRVPALWTPPVRRRRAPASRLQLPLRRCRLPAPPPKQSRRAMRRRRHLTADATSTASPSRRNPRSSHLPGRAATCHRPIRLVSCALTTADTAYVSAAPLSRALSAPHANVLYIRATIALL